MLKNLTKDYEESYRTFGYRTHMQWLRGLLIKMQEIGVDDRYGDLVNNELVREIMWLTDQIETAKREEEFIKTMRKPSENLGERQKAVLKLVTDIASCICYPNDACYPNIETITKEFETLFSKTVKDTKYTVPGDICLYDVANDTKIFVNYTMYDSELYPIDKYVPIGVVVIPSSHDVYGTGECAVMSLMSMSTYTPDTGRTYEDIMYWGGYNTDTSLTDYNVANYIGTGSNLYDSVQGTFSYPHLPSDRFSVVQCPHDTDTYYYYDESSAYQAPSPYLTDDSRNPMYYQTDSPASTNNAFSDFDGVGNTAVLTELATAQSDWKTADTITNSYDVGYHPAACCCWRYHTDGTSQGDWYLPAMGELGYLMSKFNVINDALSKAGGLQLGSYIYWSSSEDSSSYARSLYTGSGAVYRSNIKDSSRYVRAFLRVLP